MSEYPDNKKPRDEKATPGKPSSALVGALIQSSDRYLRFMHVLEISAVVLFVAVLIGLLCFWRPEARLYAGRFVILLCYSYGLLYGCWRGFVYRKSKLRTVFASASVDELVKLSVHPNKRVASVAVETLVNNPDTICNRTISDVSRYISAIFVKSMLPVSHRTRGIDANHKRIRNEHYFCAVAHCIPVITPPAETLIVARVLETAGKDMASQGEHETVVEALAAAAETLRKRALSEDHPEELLRASSATTSKTEDLLHPISSDRGDELLRATSPEANTCNSEPPPVSMSQHR